MTSRTRNSQGRALWRLRCDRQRRLRQRRDHERHGRVRRTVDPLLARTHGTAALSRSARADDHGPPAPTRKASRSAEPYRKLSPHVVACRTKLIFSTASTLAPVVAFYRPAAAHLWMGRMMGRGT